MGDHRQTCRQDGTMPAVFGLHTEKVVNAALKAYNDIGHKGSCEERPLYQPYFCSYNVAIR